MIAYYPSFLSTKLLVVNWMKAWVEGRAGVDTRSIETNAINTGQVEVGNEMASNLELPDYWRQD